MLRYETVLSVRKNLGEMLNYVEYKQDSILITRGDKISAAIVDINLFNKINALAEKFQKLTSQLQANSNNYTQAEIDNIVDEAVINVRSHNDESRS